MVTHIARYQNIFRQILADKLDLRANLGGCFLLRCGIDLSVSLLQVGVFLHRDHETGNRVQYRSWFVDGVLQVRVISGDTVVWSCVLRWVSLTHFEVEFAAASPQPPAYEAIRQSAVRIRRQSRVELAAGTQP